MTPGSSAPPIVGKDFITVLTVAVISDLNGNGTYNDAPDVVADQNADGRIDGRDVCAVGVSS